MIDNVRSFLGTLLLGGALLGLALALGSSPAGAVEFSLGDGITGSFDTTLSVGGSLRTQDRDSELIAIGNGGSAATWNGDDGNLNFDQWDPISLAAKATHELELNAGNFGFFTRFYYFYDAVVAEDWTQRTGLDESAKDISGRDVELLDLYADANFDVADTGVALRVGNQVLNWGESTFIPNGINIINPVDVARLRTAGSEIREALLPVPIVDLKLALTDKLSVEGFYQALWKNTEIDPSGTFFSTSDTFGPGGDTAVLRFGRLQTPPAVAPPFAGDNPPTITFNRGIPRGFDEEPENEGQFGFAVRYFEPGLNETEFGLYYVKHHSRLPLVSGRTGHPLVPTASCPALFPGPAGIIANYTCRAKLFREFPDNIHMVGASFNTQIPFIDTALFGEISYKIDQPLQVDDVELVFAVLSPLDPFIPGPDALGFGAQSQLGPQPVNSYVQGFRRKDVLQPQVSALKVIGPMLGADQTTLIGEIGATYVEDMEDTSVLRYEGPGTGSTGNPNCVFGAPVLGAGALCGAAPRLQTDGFADDFSWGYRVLGRLTFNNAIGPVGLSPQVAFAHDVNGTTPAPLGNFVEDRKSVTVGIGANYQNVWRADLSFTSFFGGEDFNLIHDRDFVSLTASYTY
jgi:hypothetical protein